jgi:hypothetical protein
MNNSTIQIKIKERLNKGDSGDYPDLPCWVIAEAFNKEQSAWTREQLQGINGLRAGAEGSIRRIDDLERLLTTWDIPMTDMGIYYESTVGVPADYLQYSRVSVSAVCPSCPPRPMVVYLKPVSDVDILLTSQTERPSYEWRETFCTMAGNNIRIYTNNEFGLTTPYLIYYRQPRNIEILGCVDPYTGNPVTVDVESELPDSVIEIIIDRAAGLVGGDIENSFQVQRNNQDAQQST